MTEDLDFISEEKWQEFREEMLRLVSRGHFIANVPASPEDTVHSAIATFLRRRDIGEKRELNANTPEAVRLVLLYRAWSKNKEHHRRASYRADSAKQFTTLDSERGLEETLADEGQPEPEVALFIREVLEHIDTLSERDRDIARLCMEGYSVREIAAELDIPIAAVTASLMGIRIAMLDE